MYTNIYNMYINIYRIYTIFYRILMTQGILSIKKNKKI